MIRFTKLIKVKDDQGRPKKQRILTIGYDVDDSSIIVGICYTPKSENGIIFLDPTEQVYMTVVDNTTNSCWDDNKVDMLFIVRILGIVNRELSKHITSETLRLHVVGCLEWARKKANSFIQTNPSIWLDEMD